VLWHIRLKLYALDFTNIPHKFHILLCVKLTQLFVLYYAMYQSCTGEPFCIYSMPNREMHQHEMAAWVEEFGPVLCLQKPRDIHLSGRKAWFRDQLDTVYFVHSTKRQASVPNVFVWKDVMHALTT